MASTPVAPRRMNLREFVFLVFLAYGSGTLGGLANAVVQAAFVITRVNAALHVTLNPLSPYKVVWLYNKMVWGGMWGVVHLIPVTWPHYLIRSVFYGLIVSTIHLAIVFPAQDGGMYATKYGDATFVIVYITDAAWAVTSGLVFFSLKRWFECVGLGPNSSSRSSASVNGTAADAPLSPADPLLPSHRSLTQSYL